MKKRWVIGKTNLEKAQRLARELRISLVLAKILIQRGLYDRETVRNFLWPRLVNIHAPQLFLNIDKAVERISRAIEQQELITVYGDYDVDGVTGTALLLRCLKLLGGIVNYYIPHRMEEGYGLNPQALANLHANGTRLLITIDCGIRGHATIRKARELGVDVIVTDHHETPAELPDAYAVVNPKDQSGNYPFYGITGVGVAFKIAWALCQHFSNGAGAKVSPRFRDFLLEEMALVALGTVADVAPMIDENRAMTKYGLQALARTRNPGLQALKEICHLSPDQPITEEHVGFRLGPRINAMGRLNHSASNVELLTTSDLNRARELARALDSQNRQRRRVEQLILEQALEQIAKLKTFNTDHSIVLAGEGWHPGVVGIVASRLVERYYRPVVMIALDGSLGRASARSIPNLHLCDALQACASHLLSFGGHALAAGFKIQRDQIGAFRRQFDQFVARKLTPRDFMPVLHIDAEVSLEEISWSLVKELELLAPFGEQNLRPYLMVRNVQIAGTISRCGQRGNHLNFWIRQGNTVFRTIAFGMGELYDRLRHAGKCSLVFYPKINTWGGNNSLELEAKDIAIDLEDRLA